MSSIKAIIIFHFLFESTISKSNQYVINICSPPFAKCENPIQFTIPIPPTFTKRSFEKNKNKSRNSKKLFRVTQIVPMYALIFPHMFFSQSHTSQHLNFSVQVFLVQSRHFPPLYISNQNSSYQRGPCFPYPFSSCRHCKVV